MNNRQNYKKYRGVQITGPKSPNDRNWLYYLKSRQKIYLLSGLVASVAKITYMIRHIERNVTSIRLISLLGILLLSTHEGQINVCLEIKRWNIEYTIFRVSKVTKLSKLIQ
jgi:hypothetical protein